MTQYEFEAEVWEYQGKGSWHFVTLPFEIAFEVRLETEGLTRGFRTVFVEARIGKTAFKTSLFPSKELGSYVLPIKASVRKAETISKGQTVKVHLRLA